MKLISVKFWIAHKPLKCEWKCLISSKWSGNIICSTLYKRIKSGSSWNLTCRQQFFERCKLTFVQCGPEDTGNGNTSSAVRSSRSILETLRTFALIVSAHPYCARKFTRHVMHRARALSNKIDIDSKDDHCCSFGCIYWSRMFGDSYFSFQNQILFTIFSTLSKNEQKNQCGKLKNIYISVHGIWNPAILWLQGAWNFGR